MIFENMTPENWVTLIIGVLGSMIGLLNLVAMFRRDGSLNWINRVNSYETINKSIDLANKRALSAEERAIAAEGRADGLEERILSLEGAEYELAFSVMLGQNPQISRAVMRRIEKPKSAGVPH